MACRLSKAPLTGCMRPPAAVCIALNSFCLVRHSCIYADIILVLPSATFLHITRIDPRCAMANVWSDAQGWEEKLPHLSLLRFSDHGVQSSQGFLMLKDLALLRLCKRLQLLHLGKPTLFRYLHAQRALCVCDTKPLHDT